MTIRLSEIQITEVSDTTTGGQTFHDLAVDPNNPNTEVDGRDFLVWQRGYATDDGLLLPAVQDDGLLLPAVRDDGLLLPAVQDDGLLLPAVQIGGVSVASADVNGDNSALGDPITFTYTVTNTSSAYEGSHALYQDVVIPALETDVRKGEWIADVTYQSVELLGQPTETFAMTYERIDFN